MSRKRRPIGSSDVRPVSWGEICIPDDRKYLEIVSTDYPGASQRLDALCECGAQLQFVRAEAGRRRSETCCCGRCAVPFLFWVGACPGCRCDDCAGSPPCPLLGMEMGFDIEGDDVAVFLRPALVPVP